MDTPLVTPAAGTVLADGTIAPVPELQAEAQPGRKRLTMYDLPSEDPEEPGLPDHFHALQPQLLSRTLRVLAHIADQILHVPDMNIYYDEDHPSWYKRPDWFLVLGVPFMYGGYDSRLSYVIWDEEVPPTLIVEFLSEGTETEDLGPFYQPKRPRKRKPGEIVPSQPKQNGKTPRKFEVYEQILKVPNYVVYDRPTGNLWYFRLIEGHYQPQPLATNNPRCWIPEVGAGLGLWSGRFEGMQQTWLRWCDAQGNWYWTDTEEALQQQEEERRQKEEALQQQEEERRQKEKERRLRRQSEAELAQERLERQQEQAVRDTLFERLRQMGIDPDQLL